MTAESTEKTEKNENNEKDTEKRPRMLPEGCPELLKAVSEAALEAGAVIVSAQNAEESAKTKSGEADFVTSFDVAVQKLLCEKLHRSVPDALFLCEEGDDTPEELRYRGESDRLHFIIDPIDGTTNFIHSCRHSAVSVAVCRGSAVIAGAVFNPYKNELFCASEGFGAYLNGRRIHTGDRPLRAGIAIFGTTPYRRQYTEQTFAIAKALFSGCQDLRRSGSAALDMCDAACGRAAVYAEYLISPWDFAGGLIVAKEAGCVMTDLHGCPLDPDSETSVVVGCPTAQADALEKLKDIY